MTVASFAPSASGRLLAAVCKRRPALRHILDTYGDMDLFSYAQTLPKNDAVVDAKRKQEFIATVGAHTALLLGIDTAMRVRTQLERFYTVSTADHHGPLTHPFFVHANILSAAPFVTSPEYQTTIVLASSNVSLGNSSLPRSLLFHTKQTSAPSRINLCSARFRSAPVYGFPAYTAHDITEACHKAKVAKAYSEKLGEILDEVYANSQALSYTLFSDQITYTNALLWKTFFKASPVALPDLAYLSLEDIVVLLLRTHHMYAKSEFHDFLFTSGTAIETAFEGIPAAFSKEEKIGTFLFWYQATPKGKRIPLWKNSDALVSDNGLYRIPFTPDAIDAGLSQGTLIPSTLLSLTLLSAYYGVKCLGGFSQTTYLALMQEAYKKVTRTAQAMPEASALCSDFVIAVLEREDGTRTPATGIDLALHGDSGSWERFILATKNLTVSASLGLMLPELYRILYTEEEREADLGAITSEMLLQESKDRVASTLTLS